MKKAFLLMNRYRLWFLLLSVGLHGFLLPVHAQNVDLSTGAPMNSDAPIGDATAAEGFTEGEQAGMTLYNLIEAGGWIMYVLGALSIIALALVLYYCFTLTERYILPRELANQIRHYLRDGRYEDVARLCRRSKGLLAKVVLAGILRGAVDPAGAAGSMEIVGRREAEVLMRRVRYLSDIGTICPMLGLLGTVLGMINAFNFIAFDISAVKPVALASAVAQALVTTAAGLIIGIPCMGFFFFFRGKLHTLIARVEEVSMEVSDLLTTVKPKKIARRKTASPVEEEA